MSGRDYSLLRSLLHVAPAFAGSPLARTYRSRRSATIISLLGGGRNDETGTDAAHLGSAADVRANVNCGERSDVTSRPADARGQSRGTRAVHRMGGPRLTRAAQHAGEPGAVRRGGSGRG